jgi:hypothetical protein
MLLFVIKTDAILFDLLIALKRIHHSLQPYVKVDYQSININSTPLQANPASPEKGAHRPNGV